MGFVRNALALTWPEDSEFAGLTVRMKRLSIRQLLNVQALQDLRASEDTKESTEALGEILDLVGKSLLGWNLETETEVDGETVRTPVPATREALDDQDVDMVLQVISTWIEAAAAVPLASSTNSPPGSTEAPPVEEWAAYLGQSQEPLPEPVS